MRKKQVVTWQTPRGLKRNICRECQEAIEGTSEWPRDAHGEEFCQVHLGLHRGLCDICQREPLA